MASQNHSQLHFVLLPHLAQGHIIPMIDMAKLLARRDLSVTIVTTPLNASRFETTVRRAAESGLRIQLLRVPFPSAAAGLPDGCESMDTLPSRAHVQNLLSAVNLLQQPIEHLLGGLNPRPSCIISDKYLAWTHDTARNFRIPRLVFDGTSCFSLLCTYNILDSGVHETVAESEPFVVPGLSERIELTKLQLPAAVGAARDEIREKELAARGVVVNTFEELESEYVKEFRKVRGGMVWCIGPVSLCNNENSEKSERGNKASIDETQCLNWLDTQAPGSVLYACLGSQSRLAAPQLIEIGLALESSKHPFVWVVKDKLLELEKWMSDFERRIRGRGLLIKGWAPQVLILSHSAVGGFLTHCGWNSTLEGICGGVPMVTWPMFAEQFYNEKFIVQVLKVGVGLGSKFQLTWGEEEKFGVVMRREDVKKAVEEVMDEGEEGQERRKRAKELGEMARGAIEEGGSSYLNLTLLIQDVLSFK